MLKNNVNLQTKFIMYYIKSGVIFEINPRNLSISPLLHADLRICFPGNNSVHLLIRIIS